MTFREAQQTAKVAEAQARQMAAAIRASAAEPDSELLNLASDRQMLTVPDTQLTEITARRSARVNADTAALFVRLAETRQDQVSGNDVEEHIRSFGAFAADLIEKASENTGRQFTDASSTSQEPTDDIRIKAIQALMSRLERRTEEERLWLVQQRLKAWQQALASLAELCTEQPAVRRGNPPSISCGHPVA